MKRTIVIVSLLIVLLLTACGWDEKVSDTVETDRSDEIVMMTEQEKELLKDLYIDEERIEEGKLYSYQEKCLEQLRFGMSYLAEKYPDTKFKILVIHPKSKINMITRIAFEEEGNKEKEYTLTIEANGDGWQATDNYLDR